MAKINNHRKILILSYHYHPLPAISSLRAKGFAENLHDYGWYPTVVTHIWEGWNPQIQTWTFHNQEVEVQTEEHQNHRVIRVPRYKKHLKSFFARLYANRLLRKVVILFYWLFGHLEATPEHYGSYRDFRSFLQLHLKRENYDALMVIYSPNHHLKLGAVLSKQFNIPLWFDLRDVWPGNRIARIDYRPTKFERLQDAFYTFYWRRWFRQCEGFSITSKPWADILSQRVRKIGFVVTNGYEKDIFKGITSFESSVFTVAHIGTLYEEQPLQIFFEGLFEFTSEPIERDIQVLFIGVRGTMEERIAESAEACGVTKYVSCHPRVLRKEALRAMLQAEMLFYPAWPHVQGTYSGKIFEYLASGTSIIIAPGDKGVIDELIKETQAGSVCYTPDQVASALRKRYNAWKGKGIAEWQRNSQRVRFYSREQQTKRLAQLLNQHVL